MVKFWNPLKAYRKECILGPAFKLLEALFELTVPLIIARLVDEGLRLHIHSVIVQCALLLVLMAVLGLAASVTAQFFAARAAIGFASRIRHALFDHIQSLSYSDLDSLGSSTLITRLTGDIVHDRDKSYWSHRQNETRQNGTLSARISGCSAGNAALPPVRN